jgi:hypothetical protein
VQTQLKSSIHIKDASNVIVRNIVINGPASNVSFGTVRMGMPTL